MFTVLGVVDLIGARGVVHHPIAIADLRLLIVLAHLGMAGPWSDDLQIGFLAVAQALAGTYDTMAPSIQLGEDDVACRRNAQSPIKPGIAIQICLQSVEQLRHPVAPRGCALLLWQGVGAQHLCCAHRSFPHAETPSATTGIIGIWPF